MKKEIGIKAAVFEYLFLLMSLFYRIKNFNKPKILLYTDSRGYNVLSKYGRNPFDSYVGFLIKKYNIKYYICEQKHTTILDFLEKFNLFELQKYRAVILHCGIVDFSPRPISNLNWVLNSKKFNSFFNKAVKDFGDYYNNPCSIQYNGEKTLNLYSKKFLKEIVLARLKNIDKLIWISSNNFVRGWEGNYPNGRPKNINKLVHDFEKILHNELKNVVDLRVWSDKDVRKFTIDNIHFTKEGFLKIFNLIDLKIVLNN